MSCKHYWRDAWLVNSPLMRSPDGWKVCKLAVEGGGTALANYLTAPDERPPGPPDRARRVGRVRIDNDRWRQWESGILLTDAEFLALWEKAAPAADSALCRWCKGTGTIDVSVGRGRMEPCLDCAAGKARRGGKA